MARSKSVTFKGGDIAADGSSMSNDYPFAEERATSPDTLLPQEGAKFSAPTHAKSDSRLVRQLNTPTLGEDSENGRPSGDGKSPLIHLVESVLSPHSNERRFRCPVCDLFHLYEAPDKLLCAQVRGPMATEKPCILIEQFNADPRPTCEIMLKTGIAASLEEVCDFLQLSNGMDRAKVGELFGHTDEFSKKLLHCFAHGFNFSETPFHVALRCFMGLFQPPGEAQQMDRILQAFAASYYCQNFGGIFESADACHALAFSTVILNTDSNHPAIPDEKRMSRPQFGKMNRGINDGSNVSPLLLDDIFQSVKQRTMSVLQPAGRLGSNEVEVQVTERTIGLTIQSTKNNGVGSVLSFSPKGPVRWLGCKPKDVTGQYLVAIQGFSIATLTFTETMWYLRNMRRPLILRFRKTARKQRSQSYA